ncbi:hypothetical protein BKA70DRAFT_1431943 [Coprinopsis sp. MPI-PUGE-AT-0042]|nr:hypothetical protein BKA70DRAFT_1431943 [Coprinopsis sp. MPI-PUGE-AT-0042]
MAWCNYTPGRAISIYPTSQQQGNKDDGLSWLRRRPGYTPTPATWRLGFGPGHKPGLCPHSTTQSQDPRRRVMLAIVQRLGGRDSRPWDRLESNQVIGFSFLPGLSISAMRSPKNCFFHSDATSECYVPASAVHWLKMPVITATTSTPPTLPSGHHDLPVPTSPTIRHWCRQRLQEVPINDVAIGLWTWSRPSRHDAVARPSLDIGMPECPRLWIISSSSFVGIWSDLREGDGFWFGNDDESRVLHSYRQAKL